LVKRGINSILDRILVIRLAGGKEEINEKEEANYTMVLTVERLVRRELQNTVN